MPNYNNRLFILIKIYKKMACASKNKQKTTQPVKQLQKSIQQKSISPRTVQKTTSGKRVIIRRPI